MVIKKELHSYCLSLIETKVKQANDLMLAAEESANSESKSSAGDKYETGREMAIQELNKAGQQKELALAMKSALLKIDSNKVHSKVQIGSLVKTNKGIFYITVSLGNIEYEGEKYFILSGKSPLSEKLIGLELGQTLDFNGISYTIDAIL